jgi:hypothetical protein
MCWCCCGVLAQHRLDLEAAAGGSISAEHGVGLLKRKYLPLNRSAVELEVMKQIKVRDCVRRLTDEPCLSVPYALYADGWLWLWCGGTLHAPYSRIPA